MSQPDVSVHASRPDKVVSIHVSRSEYVAIRDTACRLNMSVSKLIYSWIETKIAKAIKEQPDHEQ